MVHAGSIHRANGGYLIIEAKKLFAQPNAVGAVRARPALAHRVENLIYVGRHKLGEMLRRDLARHRVHHGDHIRPRLNVRVRHLAADRAA